MQQQSLALAEIPADEDHEYEHPLSPATPADNAPSKRQRIDDTRLDFLSAESATEDIPNAFDITESTVTDHERILAEFCMNVEDTAEAVVAAVTAPAVSPSPTPDHTSSAVPTYRPPLTLPVRSITSDIDNFWDEKMRALIKYGEEKGHCNVPFETIYILDTGAEIKLGVWVFRQKALKKQNSLPEEREKLFEPLVTEGKFEWELEETVDKVWYQRYELVLDYLKEHGHCNIPWNYVHTDPATKEVVDVGEWMRQQRQLKRDCKLYGEYDILITSLIEYALRKTGKDERQDIVWDMKYAALEQFAIENGHCNIKTGKHMSILADGTEANIGTWLNTQRGLKRKDMLREDKLIRLQSLVDKGYLTWNCKRASVADFGVAADVTAAGRPNGGGNGL